MDQTLPFVVSVLFSLLLIGLFAAIIGVFVAGVFAVKDMMSGDDEDDNDGGDEGFTPDPWGSPSSSNPVEHEDELTLV